MTTILLHPTAAAKSSAPVLPVEPRDPLPPWPEPVNYLTSLPPGWPPPPTRDFLRANCWTVPVPGLPFVEGGSSYQMDRFLSWFWDRYPKEYQQKWIDENQKRGYTHAFLSAPDAMLGPSQLSLQGFVDNCGTVKARMPYCCVFLGSKVFNPQDQSVQQWADYADPIMDALIAAKVVDEFILGWEWNFWNVPGQITIDAFKHAGQKAHAAGCSFWLHFSTEVTSWFADPPGESRGRYGFYDDLGHDVDGLNYQAQGVFAAGAMMAEPAELRALPREQRVDHPDLLTRSQKAQRRLWKNQQYPPSVTTTSATCPPLDWSIDQLQAHMVDTLKQFGAQPWGHKMRLFEDVASICFDNDPPSEGDCDQRGFASICTIDNVGGTDAKIWGAGNGLRQPDGTAA
jgi:hypothetical protein